jgi:uncharacterized tellurite resistance protein B-like protein
MVATKKKRRKLRTRIDRDAVVFDGDRDLRAELMKDPAIKQALRALEPQAALASARRELLLSSLKLTPTIAPNVYAAVDKVTATLGLEVPLEVYCISSHTMNAFIAPPDGARVLLGLSSPLLEKMDDAELTFVLGHELGHALFDHFRMAPSILFDLDERLPPLQFARLYAWMRYAELSADRVGLLCCEDVDAAIRAFFKLTSGLCDERFLRSAKEAAAQLTELGPGALESTEDDWFSTHPYGPLRIKAIDLFARSETYFSLLGRVGGDLTEAELEREVAGIMALMNPSFLDDASPCHEEIREFLLLGGLAIALADGSLDRSEERELERLVAADLRIEDDALLAIAEGGANDRLAELGHHLDMRLSLQRRKKILEDLTAIALADEQLADAEIAALTHCSRMLGIDPLFIEETLGRVSASLD